MNATSSQSSDSLVECSSAWATKLRDATAISPTTLPASSEGDASREIMEARLERCRKRFFHRSGQRRHLTPKAESEHSSLSKRSLGELAHVHESVTRRYKRYEALACRSEISPALGVLSSQESAERSALVTQSLGDLPCILEETLPVPSAHTLDELPCIGKAMGRFDSSRNRMLRRTKAPNVRTVRDVVAYWRTRRNESDENIIGRQVVWKPPPLRRTVLDFQRGSRVWSDDDCATSHTTDDLEHVDVDSLLDFEEEGELDVDLDGFELAEF